MVEHSKPSQSIRQKNFHLAFFTAAAAATYSWRLTLYSRSSLAGFQFVGELKNWWIISNVHFAAPVIFCSSARQKNEPTFHLTQNRNQTRWLLKNDPKIERLHFSRFLANTQFDNLLYRIIIYKSIVNVVQMQ